MGADIDGPSPGDGFGWAIDMPNENVLAIGAIYSDGNGSNSGNVVVYDQGGFLNTPDLSIKNTSIIYPNPTHDYVYISLNNDITASSINIYDVSGRLVLTKAITAPSPFKLNVSNLKAGTYLLTVNSTTHRVSQKIIIQ